MCFSFANATLSRTFASEFSRNTTGPDWGRCVLYSSKNAALLRDLGFERFEPLLHGGQVMPYPDTTDTGRRNAAPLFGEFIGDPMLTSRGLIDRNGDDRVFEVAGDAIAEIRLAAADFAERLFAAGLVQLLEAIEAVSAVAHHLTGLRHVTQLLGELQHSHFGLD